MATRKVLVAAVVSANLAVAGAVFAIVAVTEDGRGEPALPTPGDLPPVVTATASAGPTTASSPWALPPAPGTPWQLVLDGGAPKTDKDALIIELDWETPASQIRDLNARGIYTVCYFSAGSWEEWRPDADDYPESVLGEPLEDWPGERYVDLADLDTLLPLWEARIDACAAAGFDAIDPDNIDAYANKSGFRLSEADGAIAFQSLAWAAHDRGLGIGLKNSPEISRVASRIADFAVVEECIEYGFCADFAPFVDAGKPVLVVEYRGGMTLKKMCGRDDTAGLSLLLQTYALDGPGERCPA